MQAKIAKTTLATTPDDKAVAVDVYGTPPQQPTNNIKDPVTKIPPFAMNVLGQKQAQDLRTRNLIKAIDYFVGGNKEAFGKDGIGAIATNFGVPRSVLFDTTGPLLNGVLKQSGFMKTDAGKIVDGWIKAQGGDNLEKLLTGGYTNARVLIGRAEDRANVFRTQFNRAKDIKSLTDLSNFINQLAGDSEFIKVTNLGGLIQGAKAIADMANSYGLPGVIDRVIARFNKDDQKNVLLGLASSKSALYDINYLRSLTNTNSSTAILTQNPMIIKQILSNFRSTSEFPIPSAEAARELVKVLEKIDVNWHSHKYGERYIYDLDIFGACNEFVMDCFKRANLFTEQLMICKQYRTELLRDTAIRLYPYIAIPA